VRDSLEEQYKKAKIEEERAAKAKKEKEAVEKVNNSLWGQMDTNMNLLKETVTKVQGYDDISEKEVEVKEPSPPPKKLSAAEQEKQEEEKLKLFSEFVAADAEAS
jgi:hypothetical protein